MVVMIMMNMLIKMMNTSQTYGCHLGNEADESMLVILTK
jgi:hypothetical protein